MKIDENDTKNLLNVNGKWYLRAMVNGAVIKQSLKTTSLGEARRIRDERLAAIVGKRDEKALYISVARQIKGIEAEELVAANDKRSGLKVASLWEKFISDPEKTKCGKDTLKNYVSAWRKFSDWLKENHPEVQFCRQFSRGIGKEYSIWLNKNTGSIVRYNGLLTMARRVIETAVDLDENVINPLERQKSLPPTDVVPKEMFTEDELRKLFADDDQEFVRLCAVGLYTTQRFEVARTLKWEMFDEELAYLDVVHHKTGAPGSMRVPKEMREILSRVPKEDRHGFVCPNYATMIKQTASVTFQEKLQSHGIETQREVERKPGHRKIACVKGFHSFRHTANTIAKRNCPNSAKILRLMGHESERMNAHYTHLGADDAGDAADCIGKFW
jgi:integrase